MAAGCWFSLPVHSQRISVGKKGLVKVMRTDSTCAQEFVRDEHQSVATRKTAKAAGAAEGVNTLASYLKSDVDLNIPVSKVKQEKTFAVIIANENYQEEVNVEFALNDGMAFREYCVKLLGIPESNLHIRKDATLNNMLAEINWMQNIAKAYGDEWKANLEWAYLSWQSTDNLMMRFGRLRTPVYMYSESIDVGFSYPWLRLPDEVYSQVQLSNYEGADIVYNLPLSFATLSFQLAGGIAKNRDYYIYDEEFDIDYDNVFGSSVSLATNDFGTFRVGYVEADIDTDISGSFTDIFGNPGTASLLALDKDKGKFTSIGYQYDNGTWLTANEWTSRVIENDGSNSTDSFYLMGGRRFGDFLAHVTYAQLDEDEGRQSSWTLGLNYNILPTVVLKGEYKRVDTTGGYDGVFVRNAQELYDNTVYDRTNGLAGVPARNYDGDIISAGVDFVF